MAVFGELTWHLTSDWSVTGGTRLFKQTVSQAQQTGLLFDGPGFVSGNSLSDEWKRALWKINMAYRLDKSNLVYATWSQGFRRGGVNALPPDQPIPARQGTVGTTCPPGSPNAGNYCLSPSLLTYQPDKADNYEIGIKGVIENRVSYSADIYDIQWHNVQEGTSLTPLSLPSAANVGNAYSRGVELDMTASITHHLAVKLGYAYDQTKLTSFDFVFSQNVTVPLPPPGGPLPGTPKNSVALGLEYAHVPLRRRRVALRARFALSEQDSVVDFGNGDSRARLYDARWPHQFHSLALARNRVCRQHHQHARRQRHYRPDILGQSYPGSHIAAAHVRLDVRIFIQGVLSFGYANARTTLHLR